MKIFGSEVRFFQCPRKLSAQIGVVAVGQEELGPK